MGLARDRAPDPKRPGDAARSPWPLRVPPRPTSTIAPAPPPRPSDALPGGRPKDLFEASSLRDLMIAILSGLDARRGPLCGDRRVQFGLRTWQSGATPTGRKVRPVGNWVRGAR